MFFSTHRIAAIGCATLFTVAALDGAAARAQGGPQDKDVVVTNTAANPVPVVNVDRNVTVANTAANPALVRNVDEGSRQPFQRPFSIELPAGEAFGVSTFTVPAGKRLVVEFASMRASLPPGQSVFVNIVTTVAGQSAFHPVVVSDQGLYGAIHLLAAAQGTRLYADAGTDVTVQFARDPSAGAPGEASFFMTLSGYRVDVP